MAHEGLAITVPSLRIAPVRVGATRVIDVRAVHARVLWDSGWGRGGRFQNFAAYLATIPPIPRPPVDVRFNQLVLVDRSVLLTAACRLLGISYGGDDSVFDLYDGGCASARLPEVYWIWVQSGRENRGLTPYECVHMFGNREMGLTAFEGVSFFATHSELLNHHAIDLVASRLGSYPAYNACLLLGDDGAPTLGVAEYCVGAARRGTASRFAY